MKTLKYILSFALVLLLGCTEDDNDLRFLEEVVAPSEITALFQVTQDNTGTVTITPNAAHAVAYNIDFGDDTEEPANVKQGENIQHIYAEGTYTVTIEAVGITGLKANTTKELVVSFKAPENVQVTIENDLAVSKKVNVTATADFATSFDVYFGEPDSDTPVSANIGETASFVYQAAGTYTIRVVVMGAAMETTEYTEEFTVTEILQPIESAPMPPARAAQNVIGIYGSAYPVSLTAPNYFPDWGQGGQGSSWTTFSLNGDEMLQYINLSYQGIDFGQEIDASNMEYLHLDVWTTDVTDLEVSAIRPGPEERPVTVPLTADAWTSIDIPLSDYTDQGLTLGDVFQLKLVGTPWATGTVFIDNIYFWKAPEPASGLEGTWKIAPEAGALKVGPAPNDGSWWSSDAQTVIDRACYFDDVYVFNLDGTFKNSLGTETWLEAWQGVASEQCGAPVAPHDGTNPATFIYDAGAGTVTLTGNGAYLGLPKVNNAGELPNVTVPNSITYAVELTDNNNTMNITIESGTGVFWSYKLIRYTSPLVGTWKVAPEAGALKVGPAPNDGSWWSSDAQTVTDRACYFDDEYIFGSDGSFDNNLGTETWLEAWQGVASDQCGAPVAPHDGTGQYTFDFDEASGTLTLIGSGAYLGLPKVNNTGELPNVPVPNTITYDVNFVDSNTINVVIEVGTGVFWTYKLVK